MIFKNIYLSFELWLFKCTACKLSEAYQLYSLAVLATDQSCVKDRYTYIYNYISVILDHKGNKYNLASYAEFAGNGEEWMIFMVQLHNNGIFQHCENLK